MKIHKDRRIPDDINYVIKEVFIRIFIKLIQIFRC
jgi:hypothetical protein